MPDETITNMAAAYLSAKQARQSGASWLDATLQGVIGAAGMEKAAADPLFAYKKEEAGQAIEMNALKLQQAQLERTLQLQQQAGLTELAKVLADSGGTDKLGDPATMQRLWDIGSRYPGVVGSPEFTNVQTMLQKARMGKAAAEAFKNAAAAPMAPGTETHFTDPNTGIEYRRTGPPQPRPQTPPEIVKELNALQEARARGDTETATFLEARIKKLATDKGMGFEITGYDEQGRPLMRMGEMATTPVPPTMGKPTVATQTKVQADMGRYERAVGDLVEISSKTGQFDVGPVGAAADLVLDRFLANFMPDLASQSRVEHRTKIDAFVNSVLREVSDTQRFTNADRKAVEEMLPSTGAKDSAARIKRAIPVIKRVFAKRARVDAQLIGQPTPVWAMDFNEARAKLQRDVATGALSADAAAQIMASSFTDEEAAQALGR